MKKFTLTVIVILMITNVFTQQDWKNSYGSGNSNRDIFVSDLPMTGDDLLIGHQDPNPTVLENGFLEYPVIGSSLYDQQVTNIAPRMYLYSDGTIGATFIMSHQNDFTDRGTGYNYFDGVSWGAQPSSRIESARTGWPSYAPFGPDGEIVVSHQNTNSPLVVCTRNTKGSGMWTESFLDGPQGASGIGFLRMITNGPDNQNIHILALTGPVAAGGNLFQGLDGAIVYTRSLDGGSTWEEWRVLDGMTAQDYLGFNDTHTWAQAKGDTLAFVVGYRWYDLFIMKSLDNGASWTKTLLWPCPFNLWQGGDTTGTF